MKYNIEKINRIAEQMAEMVKEAIEEEQPEKALIGDVEMALREGLREIGQQALRCFLENADGEARSEIKWSMRGHTMQAVRVAKDVHQWMYVME